MKALHAALAALLLASAPALAQTDGTNTTNTTGAGGLTPSVNGTGNATLNGTALAITLETPASGAREVCWTVQGSGTVAETALYWDTRTHAPALPPPNGTGGNATGGNGTDGNASTTVGGNATGTTPAGNGTATGEASAGTDGARLALYAAGKAFPGGNATADPSGHALPGRFCATLPATTTGTVFLVAAVVHNDARGVLVSNEVSHTVSTTGPGTDAGDGATDDNDTEEEATGETPSPGLVLVLAIAGLAAVALRRRKT